jgi:hypothetical protein
MVYGEEPGHIFHLDGNGCNNRLDNLKARSKPEKDGYQSENNNGGRVSVLPKMPVGGYKFNQGGGMSQYELLQQFEDLTKTTAAGAAELLDTKYNTYKQWKMDRRNMTGPSIKLVQVLTKIKGTEFGEEFGV